MIVPMRVRNSVTAYEPVVVVILMNCSEVNKAEFFCKAANNSRYLPCFDEMFDEAGNTRPAYAEYCRWFAEQPPELMRRKNREADDTFLESNLRVETALARGRCGLWDFDLESRKLVWSRAARVPWKQISGELGCDRTTAWRRWQLALTKIAARLNAQ